MNLKYLKAKLDYTEQNSDFTEIAQNSPTFD